MMTPRMMTERFTLIMEYPHRDFVESLPSARMALARARLSEGEGGHAEIIDPNGNLIYETDERII